MADSKADGKEVEIRKNSGAMVSLMPDDAEGVFKISQYLAKSDLVPKSFAGRPENVFAAIMYGREIGVSAMQALSNIAVVNGRASAWGELVVAIILNSGTCEYLKSPVFKGSGDDLTVTVEGKRKGQPEPAAFTYTMKDAILAGNSQKDTYKKHPKDMIYWKAMSRLAKFLWADALKGLSIREVAFEDVLEAEVVPSVEVEEKTPAKPAPVQEAKAEIPAEKAKAPAKPKEAPVREVAAEEALGDAQEAPNDRITGTLVEAIKLSDKDTGAPLGFAIKVKTANGEEKFQMASLEEAMEAKKHIGKEVELKVGPLDKPIVNIVAKVIELSVSA